MNQTLILCIRSISYEGVVHIPKIPEMKPQHQLSNCYKGLTSQMIAVFYFSIIVGIVTFLLRGCPRGVMVTAMDCGIVEHEFVLQSGYYVHFRANTLGKGMNPLILPAMG